MAVIAALVVTADQITKSLAVADLATHSVHVLGPFSFRLAYNTGVAFSVGTGLTGPIIIVAVALVLAISWMARGVPTMTAATAFGLVLGGAIGNLCDRLFRGHHGAVIDFVYTRFWPTFNVADSCIVVGCVLLAISFARTGRLTRHATASPTASPPTASPPTAAPGRAAPPEPGSPTESDGLA
ncbi:MAG: signal peptidase II [Acidimicrobiales bacterium]|jgi:signal peptidase II